MRRPAWFDLAAVLVAFAATRAGAADDPALVERFEKEVRPILVKRCLSCHGAEKQKGGLRLDSRASALAGGGTGPAINPGKPAESLLVLAINYSEDLQMPPKSKLPAEEIKILTRWVEQGAVWPGGAAPAAKAAAPFDMAKRAEHWSFRPVKAVEPPVPTAADRVRNPIDRFLLKALEAKGIGYGPEADRAVLARRLSFDLIGLPPTPEEIREFVEDKRPDAHERLVDRLLASERYGERWGRHWLDVVRFGETAGHEFDYDIPFTWRYRDYVIKAFNQDVPYDKFVVEHLAGDLLTQPRRDPADGSNESIRGTGFFLLGEGTHSPVDVREEQQRRTDNQIEVIGKAFLGLTIACTRCHDHKFDPMTQKDYYALAGIVESTRHRYASIEDPRRVAAARDTILKTKRFPISLDRKGLKKDLKLVDQNAKPGPSKPPETWEVFEGFDRDLGDWTATGEAFGTEPSGPTSRRLIASRLFAVPMGVAHSGLVSDRLGGVLRSPTFKISRPYIQFLAAGKQGDINVVIDGFEKIRSPIYGGLKHPVNHGEDFKWLTIDVGMWRGHDAYIEIADGQFADFSGGQTRASEEANGWVAVDEVRFADSPTAEGPEAFRFPHEYLKSKDETFDAWADRLTSVIETGCRDGSAEGLINWAIERGLLSADLNASVAGQQALRTILTAESKLIPPRLVPAVVDGTGKDAALLIRGQAKTPGKTVPRRFLEVLGGAEGPAITEGSGRLELARRVVDESNPLFARVMVNRLWKLHFGEGIVRSMDDFGVMGETPSHPELLDWLADRFVKEGYSIKAMHRLMLNSTAYRLASKLADEKTESADPNNRLLHRASVRRLEAEPIRDAMLAAAGRLDLKMGGPGVPPHLTPYMEGRGRPGRSGPLDGDGRRSVYLNVRRNFLSPFLLVFDFPPPATTMGRRNVSNVPAQALTLLNDPFVLEQAKRWADRERQRPGSDSERLKHAYLTGFGREPDERETAAALAFLKEVQAEKGEAGAWAELCHGLMNTKAFVFVE